MFFTCLCPAVVLPYLAVSLQRPCSVLATSYVKISTFTTTFFTIVGSSTLSCGMWPALYIFWSRFFPFSSCSKLGINSLMASTT